jgi:hypothetical protein
MSDERVTHASLYGAAAQLCAVKWHDWKLHCVYAPERAGVDDACDISRRG